MNPSLKSSRLRWILSLVGVVLIFSLFAYLVLIRSVSPRVPPALVLSGCSSVSPTVRRVGSKRTDGSVGLQFDVPDRTFSVHPQTRDMPPGTVYVITSNDGHAMMEIAIAGRVTFDKELDSSFLTFSEHVEERDVRTSTGQVIGKDRWGYLKNGDSWRFVRVFAGDEAGYRPLVARDARLMDEIINMACIGSPTP
jgi:hypothetical protein